MAFGSLWRNRGAAYEGANQESREAAKCLASRRDALQFPLRTRRLQLRLIFRRDGNGFALAILL